MTTLEVYVEVGSKRAFAGALAWPGWCRGGRDEDTALLALLDYAPRYRAALGPVGRGLSPPKSVADLVVRERLRGDATTDFGAPGAAPAADAQPLDAQELARVTKVVRACWTAFDAVAAAAGGATLRTGPRGGGRDLAKITEHVLEAERAYLGQLGGKPAPGAGMEQIRDAFVEALGARNRGELPDRGPRGGVRWVPRYAVRRSAWHALDHAWEIEDRAVRP